MSTERQNGISKVVLWAAIAASMAGILFYNIMPLYLGSLQDATGLSGGQIGIVASVFFLGFNLVSASTFFWVRHAPIRLTTVGCMTALAILFPASALVTAYPAILLFTFLIGGASGALGSIAATIVSASEESAKWFGIKVGAESAAGVILLFALPATLIPAFGFMGTVMGSSVMILLLLPAVILIGNGELGTLAEPESTRETHTNVSPWAVWLALAASLVVFFGGSAIWAFEERIANLNQYDPVWVGLVLGISLIFAVFGSLAAGPLGARFSMRTSFAIGAAFMVAGVAAIGAAPSATIFAIGAISFMVGWGAAVPFLYAKIAETDPDGRHITLAIPAIGIGSMFGPAIAGVLYSSGSLQVLQFMAIAMIVVSVGLVWLTGRDTQKTGLSENVVHSGIS